MAILLTLIACGGQGEEDASNNVVYVPENIALTSRLDETSSACISGDMVYLAGTVYGENSGTERNFTLVRVPLEGGKAEELPGFHPARLEGDVECESTGGYLRPGADGTIWLTEEVYCTGKGRTLVLRQLDGEGNELFCFDILTAQTELEAERLYDLWTDGAGTFFLNTGNEVVLLDESGMVRTILDGVSLAWNRFVTFSDGRTAALGTAQSMEGYTSLLRVIDPEAGEWSEDTFCVPSGASCFWAGDQDVLFYYTNGGALYVWRPGTAEAERVMSWVESGVDVNDIAAFSFLPDNRLAAITYDRTGFEKKAQLTLLTATDSASVPDRTVLTLATITLSSSLRANIADFNNHSDSCFISVREYLPELSLSTTDAELEQAWLRMSTDLTAGNMPDLIDIGPQLPIRQMEAKGMLEDLWPYIESDPELGRDALMERPLEAIEYEGGLYRIANSFSIETITGPQSLVGDGISWTYDDFSDALKKMPEGCSAIGIGSQNEILRQLVKFNAEYFLDWQNGTSRFDSEEFRTLLMFCKQFSDSSTELPGEVAVYVGEQAFLPCQLSGFDQIQYHKGLFGGEVSYAGWPNGGGQSGSRFHLPGQLAIAASSAHKEAAWSFVRKFLLPRDESDWELAKGRNYQNYQNSFPINRTDFERSAEIAMTPVMEEQDGVLREIPRTGTGFVYHEIAMSIDVDAMTRAEYDQIMALYNAAEGTSDYDMNLMNIIIEQAGPYFAGDKSLDDTVASIQSRVGLYLAELQ